MISGVIAEFDPFHNGHEYLIKKAKEGADAVIVCLSGSLTQRGEPSFLCKTKRAECAVKAGADLVIELPSFFSAQSAEGFARAGVSLLSRAGAERLVFGSECGDAALLERAAGLSVALLPKIKAKQKSGAGFAAAREAVLKENGFDKEAEAVSLGNDILAVEYIKAISELAPEMTFSPVLREVGRNTVSGIFAPASFIRSASPEEIKPYMPGYSYEIYLSELEKGGIARRERAEREIIYRIRTASASFLGEISEMSEGLEFAIKKAAERASSLSEMLGLAATKRYTNSRISRAVINAVTEKKKFDKSLLPPYIRVLGIGERGRALIKRASLPVIVKSADGNSLSGAAKEIFDYEVRASEFRNLCLQSLFQYGEEFRITPYVLK